MMKWLRKYVEAITADTYTLIGLAIAYFTLSGEAKKITGLLIIIGITIYLVSLPLRDHDTPDE
jgi:predicted membrane protein